MVRIVRSRELFPKKKARKIIPYLLLRNLKLHPPHATKEAHAQRKAECAIGDSSHGLKFDPVPHNKTQRKKQGKEKTPPMTMEAKDLNLSPLDQSSMQRDDGKNATHPLKASEHDPCLPVDTLAMGKLTKSPFRELRAQHKRNLQEELLSQYNLEKQRE